MLVHLDFGNSNEKFFQVGKSVTVGNFIWTPHTTMQIGDIQDVPKKLIRMFAIYVECKPIDPSMSFECVADVTVIEHKHDGNSKNQAPNQVFNDTKNKSENELHYPPFFEANYFSVCVNVKSFEIFHPKCFTSPKPNLTDIELIVGDKTFYASKHILAQHSKKFYEMIYRGDQSVDQLEITDVSPEDFLLFLEVLYDCEKGVRWSSIDEIADLSLLYESTNCSRKCELFLIRQNVCQRDHTFCDEFDLQGNVVYYCQKYGFKTFFHQILQSTTVEKIREALEEAEEYSISEEIQETLSARLAELELEASKSEDNDEGEENKIEVNTIQTLIDMIDQASINFSVPRDNLTDIVLSVGDKKYHVSKEIMANASAYFYAMFYGNFNEKNENVIELKEVDPEEFEEFLQHIYNPDRNHNAANIDYLLKLSHFFDASYNLRQCQKYILNSDSFNDAQKIYMARKYDLTYLFDQVVFKYQNVDDLKKLTLMEDFDKLDEVTFSDIKMKILENHTESTTSNRS